MVLILEQMYFEKWMMILKIEILFNEMMVQIGVVGAPSEHVNQSELLLN